MKHSFSRRGFLKTVSAGLGLSVAGFATNAPAKVKPNIMFIMVDDLGPEWISCCGAEDIETPNIDKMAKGGMRFTNAYSMPKCTPTRATVLTGQYPFRHGWVNHWDVPRWGAGCHFDWKHYTTFARVLKTAGYVTAAAGKWQINDFRVQPDAMLMHGFDDYCMWTGFESQNKPSGLRYWDPYIHTKDGSKTYKGKFSADVFVDFFVDFMKRNKNEPMMMYFPMVLTHGPLVTTPLEPNAESGLDKHKAMVRYTDHVVGKLLAAMDELQIREKTIVIFTTDNGSGGKIVGHMNGREIHGGKGNITETGARAPFIANCPGLVPSGVVTDALTDFTDMLPTFAELGGAQLPDGMEIDGKSIASVLTGKEQDSEREWIMAMGGGVGRLTPDGVVPAVDYADRVVRDKRFKVWVENGAVSRLYDLQKDPAETKNIIDSTDPDAVAALEKLTAVVESFPEKDGVPQYDPTPPQPWDKTLKPSNKAK